MKKKKENRNEFATQANVIQFNFVTKPNLGQFNVTKVKNAGSPVTQKVR